MEEQLNEHQEERFYSQVTTEYFTKCLPLLERYFGITAGYFHEELKASKCLEPYRTEEQPNIVRYKVKKDCNLTLKFDTLNVEDYLEIVEEYNPLSPLLVETILLVAYCIRERKYDEAYYNDLFENYKWDTYQSEWAKLYLFIDEMEQRENKRAEKNTTPNTSITIQTNAGMKERIVVENTDNWLFRLIKKEVSDYFPIQSVEDAQQDMESRKPRTGAKKANPFYHAVVHGIYRMLHEENAIPDEFDAPNELCEFIYRFTRFTDCYPHTSSYGHPEIFEPDLIRAAIGYLKGRASKNILPKFKQIALPELILGQDFEFRDLF